MSSKYFTGRIYVYFFIIIINVERRKNRKELMPLFSIGLMQSKVLVQRVCIPWVYRFHLHDSHVSRTSLIFFISVFY